MKTPNWWEITTPHKDITDGHFDESIFAADLGNVMDKNAPMEYMDGAMFFEKTYLTKGLKELLESVLQRTCGKGVGQSVIQLQTPFGGGKTHSLLGLFHLFKEAEKLSHIDAVKTVKKASKVKKISNVKVAAFIGTHANALEDKTPWGEIADQLGLYEMMKVDDEARIAPGKRRCAWRHPWPRGSVDRRGVGPDGHRTARRRARCAAGNTPCSPTSMFRRSACPATPPWSAPTRHSRRCCISPHPCRWRRSCGSCRWA